MTSMLLNGEAKTIPSMKPILEMLPHEHFEKFPSPRVITTHVGMSEAPEDIKIKKCKTIFTLRDPRDVAVSMYKMAYGKPWSDIPYYGSFEDYFYLFIEGKVDFNGLFHHWRDAENFFNEHPDVPVHFHSYEEALQDPVLAVNKLSDFLGLPRNDRLCRDVAEKCEFSKLKADKEPYAMKLDGENFVFRQGKCGDWKNWFTEQMLEDYYRVYDEMMTGSMFYDRYSRSNMKEI
ncbi:sulfotransferase 6B1-like [Haliotis rufescens]|uniref:sulfotransferase 6B1-like n=1 Tax=Haliotis rufescens TaxID=6454 RepID=UPI00201F037D|nr:sulfotransferase 6B1-like [Haliotis rufescens]